MYNYEKSDIIKALKSVGIKTGDNIFIHSNIGFFGLLKDAKIKQDFYEIFKSAIFEVIGKKGTLVVPTFSYSFCNKKKFDSKETPSVCGILSEMLRIDPSSKRSEDANFSVAAIGTNATFFTENTPMHSFGVNCFWERFLKKDGIFCNFNFDSASTFIHYVEKQLNVPYRYDKTFHGTSIINGEEKEKSFIHFVYDLNKPNNKADFVKFDTRARELNLVNISDLGKGQVVMIKAKDVFELIKKEIIINPAFLIKGNTVE